MFTFQCHTPYIDPQTGQPGWRHDADYIRLSNGGDVLFIQHGQVYINGTGNPLTEAQLPAWYWDAARALTPEARRAVGLTFPEDRVQSVSDLPSSVLDLLANLPDHVRAALLQEASRMAQVETSAQPKTSDMSQTPEPVKNDPEAPRPKVWTCDQCSEEMSLTRKGVHLASHARAAKRQAALAQ